MNVHILNGPKAEVNTLSGDLLVADLKLRHAEQNLDRLCGWASAKLDSVENDYLYEARKAVKEARAVLGKGG